MQTLEGAGFGLRPLCDKEFIIASRKSAILAGAGTISVAALIVVKMLAFNWAGNKLQSALRKR